MPLVLAADTTTGVNTTALTDGEVVLAELSVNAPKRHAERLVYMVDALLAEAGVPLHDVDVFAVSTGPGSFTGLRIGVAAWKGFALGCGRPLYGVPTLGALARACGVRDGVVAVALDAKMQEVYGAVYRFEKGVRTELAPMMVGPVEALLDSVGAIDVFAGEGAQVYRDRILACRPDAQFVDALHTSPRAAAVALEALDLCAAGDPGDAGAVHPVYLRQSQPEEARKRALATGGASP